MRLAAAVGVACLLILGTTTPVFADPEVSIPAGPHAVDDAVEVTLSGWEPGVVTVEVCGQRAARGSADCALGASRTVNVGPDGTAQVEIRAVAPEAGCPCVVRASTLTSDRAVTADLALAGVPEIERPPEPEEPEPEENVDVASELTASVSVKRGRAEGDRMKRLVGAALWLDLTVTVQNPTTEPSRGQTLLVIAGRNATGGEPIATVDVPELTAGQRYEAPVRTRIGMPVIGRYTVFVVAEETGPAEDPLAETSVESWPVISMTVLLFGVAWLMNRRRPRSVVRAGLVTVASMAVLVAGHALTG